MLSCIIQVIIDNYLHGSFFSLGTETAQIGIVTLMSIIIDTDDTMVADAGSAANAQTSVT